MAAISGSHVERPCAAAAATVSHDLADLDMRWQPGVAASGTGGAASPNRLLASAWPRALSGSRGTSYSDDFYHRFHLAPHRLDLGNIASTQAANVVIWNAFLEPKTLSDIVPVGAEGMNIVSGVLPVSAVNALKILNYQIAITLEGPPVADAKLVWRFTGAPDVTLPITATRIIPFPFLPNWADGIREELAWLTDILQAPTADEQRRALRLSPRRVLEARIVVQGRERQQFDLALWGWSGRVWAVPLWHDIQALAAPLSIGATSIVCDTAHREFSANGLAMLRSASGNLNAEVVEIGSVGSGVLYLKRPTTKVWPRGSRLYPAVVGELSTMPALSRLTDRASGSTVTFRVAAASDNPAAAPAQLYRGFPVLTRQPEESEELSNSMQRLLLELDNMTGLPIRTDTAGRPVVVQAHRFVPYRRAEHAELRKLLYWLQGRRRALWLPTFADDVTLTATIGALSTAMTIVNIGYHRYGGGHGRRDLRIELRNGAVHHIRVTGAVEIDAATESLSLTSTLGVAITPAEVRRISWMQLCRLDHDTVEFQHDTDAGGIGKCQLVFRGVRDDVS